VQGRYDSFEEPVHLVGEQPVVGGHHSLPLPVGRRFDTERVPDDVEDTGLALLERLEFGLERAGTSPTYASPASWRRPSNCRRGSSAGSSRLTCSEWWATL
jgi:hypothetical protein